MWSDRVSNPRPLALESGALPTALRGPAILEVYTTPNRAKQSQETCVCKPTESFQPIGLQKSFSKAVSSSRA